MLFFFPSSPQLKVTFVGQRESLNLPYCRLLLAGTYCGFRKWVGAENWLCKCLFLTISSSFYFMLYKRLFRQLDQCMRCQPFSVNSCSPSKSFNIMTDPKKKKTYNGSQWVRVGVGVEKTTHSCIDIFALAIAYFVHRLLKKTSICTSLYSESHPSPKAFFLFGCSLDMERTRRLLFVSR